MKLQPARPVAAENRISLACTPSATTEASSSVRASYRKSELRSAWITVEVTVTIFFSRGSSCISLEIEMFTSSSRRRSMVVCSAAVIAALHRSARINSCENSSNIPPTGTRFVPNTGESEALPTRSV